MTRSILRSEVESVGVSLEAAEAEWLLQCSVQHVAPMKEFQAFLQEQAAMGLQRAPDTLRALDALYGVSRFVVTPELVDTVCGLLDSPTLSGPARFLSRSKVCSESYRGFLGVRVVGSHPCSSAR